MSRKNGFLRLFVAQKEAAKNYEQSQIAGVTQLD
jgi:hypothetical protein